MIMTKADYPWLKVRLPQGKNFFELKALVREKRLHTVCESAGCPNIGECWERRTATFMILGDTCTRSCGFCDVITGRPQGLDWGEPIRVAEAIKALGLRYAVITSVNRDELKDGGAAVWAATIRQVRRLNPDCNIEVLIPDFKGSEEALLTVLEAKPDVLAHNVETVPRLYRVVRPQAKYTQSLELLERAKKRGFLTKSSVMLGLGEEIDEVLQVMADLKAVNCDILTLGQYLQPSKNHLPVVRFYHPQEFIQLKVEGEKIGLGHVEAGPLVRSSYRADMQREKLENSARESK
ncbi:MAG: lipoyl synthase [Candidatus Tectomicrobia bacterium]|nr:lipoyl synthase [Candidatus Tectomicrobia bacterium]